MKLNAMQINLLRSALLTLAQDGPTHPRMGICGNLRKILLLTNDETAVNTYSFVSRYCEGWDELDNTHGGVLLNGPYAGEYSNCWPVSREYDDDEHRQPYWEGEQLRLRHSLMAHLLSRLDAIAS